MTVEDNIWYVVSIAKLSTRRVYTSPRHVVTAEIHPLPSQGQQTPLVIVCSQSRTNELPVSTRHVNTYW